jgi:hypothetical protein
MDTKIPNGHQGKEKKYFHGGLHRDWEVDERWLGHVRAVLLDALERATIRVVWVTIHHGRAKYN